MIDISFSSFPKKLLLKCFTEDDFYKYIRKYEANNEMIVKLHLEKVPEGHLACKPYLDFHLVPLVYNNISVLLMRRVLKDIARVENTQPIPLLMNISKAPDAMLLVIESAIFQYIEGAKKLGVDTERINEMRKRLGEYQF